MSRLGPETFQSGQTYRSTPLPRKNRTFEMFGEWFEVQMSSIVQDLYLDDPLESIE